MAAGNMSFVIDDNLIKKALNIWPGLKSAEIDKIVEDPAEYVPHIAEFTDVKFSDRQVTEDNSQLIKGICFVVKV